MVVRINEHIIYMEKSGSLTTRDNKIKLLQEDGRVRKITRLEAERLQGVPDNYTSTVSKNQGMKMLGNGWTIDIIALFRNII